MNVMQQLLMMNVETLLKDFSAYRTFHKSDSVINMRIPHEVLDKIKSIADGQGVPYQSLISSVLYSLINGEIEKNTTNQSVPAKSS
jgi:predicted DNA binding CopG/RHH family protein